MEEQSFKFDLFEKVLGIIVIIVAILTIIFAILLFPPTLQIKNTYPNLIFLLCQLLISSIVCAAYFLLNEIQRQSTKFSCNIILVLRSFCSFSVVSSSICICVSNLFLITGNLYLKTKPLFLKVIFILATWAIPLIIFLIMYINKKANNLVYNNEKDCTIKSNIFIGLNYLFITIYYCIAWSICGIIIYYLCKIHKEIPNQASKKLIRVIFKYLIGIFLFFIFDISSDIVRKDIKDHHWRSILLFCLCCMNPIMVYLFVWNNQVKQNCMRIFFKKDQTDSNISSKQDEEKDMEFIVS